MRRTAQTAYPAPVETAKLLADFRVRRCCQGAPPDRLTHTRCAQRACAERPADPRHQDAGNVPPMPLAAICPAD